MDPYYKHKKYKVLVDIRGSSMAIFSNSHHIFGTF